MTRPDGGPDFGLLADWVQGHLAPADAARVAAELSAGDTRLDDAVDWLRGFLRTAADLPLHQPPPTVRQRLRRHFSRWSADRAATDPPLEGHDAVLVFDTRQELVVDGMRGDVVTETVHLAYVCELGDIVLDVVRRDNNTVDVSGQLFPSPGSVPIADVPRVAVTARWPGGRTTSTAVDELGRFGLAALSSLTDELVLTNGAVRIRLAVDLRVHT